MPHSTYTNHAPVHPRTRLYLLFEQISSNDANLGNVEIRYEGLEDEECFRLGCALTTNWMVNTLDLTSNQLSGVGTSKILQGLQNASSRVSFLNISSNSVGLEGATAIGMLLNINTAIRMLNLHECNIGNDGLVVLSNGLAANRSLDKLVLSKNQLNEDIALGALGRALQTSKLTILDLSMNKLGSQGLQALDLHTNSTLETIELWGNGISITGGIFVSDTLSSLRSKIQNLNLRSNDLGDIGAESIAFGLEYNRSLRKMWLSSNHIGDEGATHLARALRGHALESIYLSCCDIGNEGAKAFAELLGDPTTHLRVLDLYRNQIGDSGGDALAKAMNQNVSLHELNITYNRIHNTKSLKQVRFLCKCNRAGRYLLGENNLPTGLWPLVLSKLNYMLEVRFFFLREKPDLFIR